MADAAPLFLGFDLSTQGVKAVLITEDSQVTHEAAVNFDKELPHYGTTNGAIKGPDEGEVTSPVKMWLEAVDLIVNKMKKAGVDLSRVMAISGDGQV
jgi:xylulokinase